ncbi:11987_t:CDS:2 [Ambispora gerdemannii]|uniref:11987_t:CDS:1 n=1 Tax=Ambispora gerdemannii TaxID=144530 RepID=A0A9N9GUK6_9GLOM|nr:11987_t:CDS:2 [Ambispora gerdemannii]
MPPIRQHQQQLSNVEAIENIPPSSSSDPIDNNNKDKNRRGRRSPSINTRASRVGVTNFINVIKNLHPGESRNHFPITQETLQEYIDSKRKALIKAGSLEQYLQHMQAYNIALGFGWQEYNTTAAAANTITPAADVINMLVGMDIDNSNNNAARKMIYDTESQIQNHLSSCNEQSKTVSVVCFDTTSIPYVIMNQQANMSLSNLTSADSLQNLHQLYANIASLNLPSQWNTVDTSHLYYRIGNSQHFGLTDGSAFDCFWKAFIDNINEREKPAQLVLYKKQRRLHNAANYSNKNHNNERQPQTPESSTSASSPSSRKIHTFIGSTSETIVKSVTIRSKIKIYKQKIAIGENTTFASLIAFATNKAIPPAGKQFVIRSIDETLEYMPEDLVKVVLTGIEHADLLVMLENVGPIDFDYF